MPFKNQAYNFCIYEDVSGIVIKEVDSGSYSALEDIPFPIAPGYVFPWPSNKTIMNNAM